MKSSKEMSMKSGMSRKSPASVDASMKPVGGKVDADAIRSGTAPTPKTLGPRDA